MGAFDGLAGRSLGFGLALGWIGKTYTHFGVVGGLACDGQWQVI